MKQENIDSAVLISEEIRDKSKSLDDQSIKEVSKLAEELRQILETK